MELPRLATQRVTATVERKAARLVRVETEHETLLTTPEHPFATAPSGWIPAGQLAFGDWVISAQSRMLRVHSVRFEERIHPVSVFNLSVAKSHAYWVGLDRLLVHNTSCSSNDSSNAQEAPNDAALTALLREREELNRTIETLRKTTPKSEEIAARLSELLRDRHRVQMKIARRRPQPEPGGASRQEFEAAQQEFEAAQRKLEAAQRELAAFEARTSGRAEEAEPATKETDSPLLPPLLREREEINRALKTLRRTTPGSEQRRSELIRDRDRVQVKIGRLRRNQRNRIRDDPRRHDNGANQEHETARQELAAFEARQPGKAEEAELLREKTALKKQLAGAQLVYDRAQKILTWQSELADLDTRSAANEAEKLALERTRQALLEKLRKERKRATGVIRMRKRRADPEKIAFEREARRTRRHASSGADANRPRDSLEQLEEQLAELRRLPESEASRERMDQLAARIEAMRGQVALSKKVDLLRRRLYDARQRLDKLVLRGRNTREARQRIAELEQEFAAARIERMQLRLKESLLAELDNDDLGNVPRGIDETRVRELERELERELAAGTLDEQHLTGLERELGHYEPTDPSLEQLWSEFEANVNELEANMLYEARDVDARVQELQQLLEAPPSPARDADVESHFQALPRELHEERNALEAVQFELVNQIAHLQTTQASSSSGATWQQRLIAIQEEQAQIREHWDARMQARLDQTLHQLDTLQRDQNLHDETAETELTQVASLLTHQLQFPVF